MKFSLAVPAPLVVLLAKALNHKSIPFGYNNLRRGEKELLLETEEHRVEAKRLLRIITPIN